jgi:hypothetical protein
MTPAKTRDTITIGLRVKRELAVLIDHEALKNNRKRNGEINQLIEEALAARGYIKKVKKEGEG